MYEYICAEISIIYILFLALFSKCQMSSGPQGPIFYFVTNGTLLLVFSSVVLSCTEFKVITNFGKHGID